MPAALRRHVHRHPNLTIDADMRRPGLHRPLRLTNERGLAQVLNGQSRVRDVIQRTVDPNLLGGVVARLESRVYDGSVRGQLDAMRRKLILGA